MNKKLQGLLFSSLVALAMPLSSTEYEWDDDGGPIAFLGEFVYMRRAHVQNRAVVSNATREVLDTKKLMNELEFELGYRLGVSYLLSPKSTFEVLYLNVNQWSADQAESDTGNLKFPFKNEGYSNNFTHADQAKARYTSKISTAEINYWYHMTPRWANYWSVSTIVGLRYLMLKESFKLVFKKGADKSDYTVRTGNDMPAVQAGVNLQINPTDHFSWETIVKVGGIYNRETADSFLGDDNNETTLRDFQRLKWQWAFLTEASIALAYDFWSRVNLHVGYDFLYIKNVALAPEQLRRSTEHFKNISSHGEIIVHGLFTGLTIYF